MDNTNLNGLDGLPAEDKELILMQLSEESNSFQNALNGRDISFLLKEGDESNSDRLLNFLSAASLFSGRDNGTQHSLDSFFDASIGMTLFDGYSNNGTDSKDISLGSLENYGKMNEYFSWLSSINEEDKALFRAIADSVLDYNNLLGNFREKLSSDNQLLRSQTKRIANLKSVEERQKEAIKKIEEETEKRFDEYERECMDKSSNGEEFTEEDKQKGIKEIKEYFSGKIDEVEEKVKTQYQQEKEELNKGLGTIRRRIEQTKRDMLKYLGTTVTAFFDISKKTIDVYKGEKRLPEQIRTISKDIANQASNGNLQSTVDVLNRYIAESRLGKRQLTGISYNP